VHRRNLLRKQKVTTRVESITLPPEYKNKYYMIEAGDPEFATEISGNIECDFK